MKSVAFACRASFFNFHHFFSILLRALGFLSFQSQVFLNFPASSAVRSPLLTYSPVRCCRSPEGAGTGKKHKRKPDTSCETLDISVVLNFTFSICKMGEHLLQNSPSYLEPTTRSPSQFILTSLPHQFYSRLVFPFPPSSLSQKFTSGEIFPDQHS